MVIKHRPDGRSSGGTLRPLACEMSCLQRADGSALWKAGTTHILCAVYGPIAPKMAHHEDPNEAVISIVFQEGREWEDFLGKILEGCIDRKQYPRTVIEIVLQVIQADGSVLGCALHAAVAALLDAGVFLKHLPVATTCLVGTELQLDPNYEEEFDEQYSSLVMVNTNLDSEKIVGCETMGGKISLANLLKCQEAASRASPAVVAFWRLAVEQKVIRQAQTLWST